METPVQGRCLQPSPRARYFLLTEVALGAIFRAIGPDTTPYSFVFRALSFSRMKLRISSAIAKSLIHCSL